MYYEQFILEFNGHTVFHQSTIKRPPFNDVVSLDAPQVSTIYGALLQCASMMDMDPSILEEVSIGGPISQQTPSRNMLIHTAPLSPYDWQPKWVNREGRYVPNPRIYPRRIYALWRPRYSLQVFMKSEEAREFVYRAFRILADRIHGLIGANIGIGFKKKIFGTFDVKGREMQSLIPIKPRGEARVCQVLSDCPARFNSVVPLHVELRTITLRHIHPPRGIERVSHVGVYAPGSTVLLKTFETNVEWYGFMDRRTGRLTGDIVGISNLIENRYYGEKKVKALQGVFLSHEANLKGEGAGA